MKSDEESAPSHHPASRTFWSHFSLGPAIDKKPGLSLRYFRERWSALPFIGLTAHAVREERERCLNAGMAAHLTKPITMQALIAAIRASRRQTLGYNAADHGQSLK